MNNLAKTNKECCGCGLCTVVCPKNVLIMKQDREGFYYPQVVNPHFCIECNKCEKYCPELNRVDPPMRVLSCYSGYAVSESIIKECASGGLATVISTSFINSGGIVYGVKYSSTNLSVEYGRAKTFDELMPFRASKYAQSLKQDVYKSVLKDLKQGLKVLFIGLPCDVSAVKNYCNGQYSQLYTIELICHGVTSPLVHKEFINSIQKKYNSKIVNFSVRHKKNAWKPYYIKAVLENGNAIEKPFRSTTYGIAFHYLKRPSCNECKFKIYDKEYGMQADLTIGDNHGVRKENPSYNHWGSSVAIVHTDKGQELIKSCKNLFVFHAETDDIIKHNLALYQSIKAKPDREVFVETMINKGLDCTKHIYSIRVKDLKISIRKWLGRIHVNLLSMFKSVKS